MTDVLNATPPAPTASPQPPVNPIEPNTPASGLGGGRVPPPADQQQAPDAAADAKAAGKPAKRLALRDTIKSALDDVSKHGDDEDFDPSDPEAAKKAEERKAAKEAKGAEKGADKAKDGEQKADAKDKQEGEQKGAGKPEDAKAEQDRAAETPDGAKGQNGPRGPETREIIEAPSRLLPRAKELWKHVPHEVRADLMRLESEREAEVAQYRESHEFAEELREYRELAKQHGVSVKESLDRYVDIERKFADDPAQGFKQILTNLGMHPVQAMGHLMRAFGADPKTVAEHILANPALYTQLGAPMAQGSAPAQGGRTAPPDPRVEQLEQTVQQLAEREKMQAINTIAETVIKPFAAEYPEYEQHKAGIATILKSGTIEQLYGKGLSFRDQLEIALSMVAPGAISRKKAASGDPIREEADAGKPSEPVGDLRGDKSIKSSIGAVTDPQEPRKRMSIKEALEEEARRIGMKR